MEILNKIQKELKAPKSQRNTFGNYNYRSCEDILEAVKPLLGEATLTVSDEIVLIGDRYYVKATATLTSWQSGEVGKTISCSAYARESLDKKGMDVAQITGAASSYARKYALNGLFCIDDTKDADTANNTNNHKAEETIYIDEKQLHTLRDMLIAKGLEEEDLCKVLKVDSLEVLPKNKMLTAEIMIKGAKKT